MEHKIFYDKQKLAKKTTTITKDTFDVFLNNLCLIIGYIIYTFKMISFSCFIFLFKMPWFCVLLLHRRHHDLSWAKKNKRTIDISHSSTLIEKEGSSLMARKLKISTFSYWDKELSLYFKWRNMYCKSDRQNFSGFLLITIYISNFLLIYNKHINLEIFTDKSCSMNDFINFIVKNIL